MRWNLGRFAELGLSKNPFPIHALPCKREAEPPGMGSQAEPGNENAFAIANRAGNERSEWLQIGRAGWDDPSARGKPSISSSLSRRRAQEKRPPDEPPGEPRRSPVKEPPPRPSERPRRQPPPPPKEPPVDDPDLPDPVEEPPGKRRKPPKPPMRA